MFTPLFSHNDTRSMLNQSESADTIDSTFFSTSVDYQRVKYLGCVQCASKSKVLKNGIQSVQSEVLHLYSTAHRKALTQNYLRPLASPNNTNQILDVCNYGIVIGERELSDEISVGFTETGISKNKIVVTKVITPLSNIILWASIKFTHSVVKIKGQRSLAGAFFPLSCSNAVFKRSTFIRLSKRQKFLVGQIHPPLFLCILRKVSSPKVFECHLFACLTTEDAINISSKLSDIQAGISKIGSLTVPVQSEIGSHSFTSHEECLSRSTFRPASRSMLSERNRSDSECPICINQNRWRSTSPLINKYPFSVVDSEFVRYQARSDLSNDRHSVSRLPSEFNDRKSRSLPMKENTIERNNLASSDMVTGWHHNRDAFMFKPSIINTKAGYQNLNGNHLCCLYNTPKVDSVSRKEMGSNHYQAELFNSPSKSPSVLSRSRQYNRFNHVNYRTSNTHNSSPSSCHQRVNHRSNNRVKNKEKISKNNIIYQSNVSMCQKCCESCLECKLQHRNKRCKANSNDSGYPSKSGSIDQSNSRGEDQVDAKRNDHTISKKNNVEVNNYNGYIVKVEHEKPLDPNNNNYVPKSPRINQINRKVASNHYGSHQESIKGVAKPTLQEIRIGRLTYLPPVNGTSVKMLLGRFEEEEEEKVSSHRANELASDNFDDQVSSSPQCCCQGSILQSSPELCDCSEISVESSTNNQPCPPLRPVETSNLTRWNHLEDLKFKTSKPKSTSFVRRFGHFRFKSWVKKSLLRKKKKKRKPELFFDRELRYLSLAEPLDYVGGTRLVCPQFDLRNRVTTNQQANGGQFLGMDTEEGKFAKLGVGKTWEIPEERLHQAWGTDRESGLSEQTRLTHTTISDVSDKPHAIITKDTSNPKNLSQVNLIQELGYLP